MENIYKIKVKTKPDPQWLYPSERRYSASTVLGLGVVHLAFAIFAILMASLTATNKILKNDTNNNSTQESTDNDINIVDPETTLTAGPCLMCIGAVAAGFTALLSWKRWYIDHNIKLFFFMSVFSTVTSSICLVLEMILLIYASDIFYSNEFLKQSFNPKSKDVIIINILISCSLEWIWSILSTKVSLKGMQTNYPDDIALPNNNVEVQINTIHKGNKTKKIMDIEPFQPVINKTLTKLHNKNSNLPNDESHSEYCERVNSFLRSNVQSASIIVQYYQIRN
ncbi:hypothetical protein FQA39_LY06993 [Lamprigera yunnana]|nr:hypothetical protein FQA39_LY06993 [Lamprigera yunnana]